MLEQFLVTHLFAVLLIFARTGTAMMTLPGIGEFFVLPRSRLLLALSFSVLLMPPMLSILPPLPDSPVALLAILLGEIMIGFAFGMLGRFLIGTMHVAGSLISMQSGLAVATQFDPSQGGQTAMLGNFMSITAVVLLFTMDLHLLMLRSLADSYALFPPGAFPPVEDFATYFSHLLSNMFAVGVRFAAPCILIGLFLYLGAGVLSRLMPNMQVFFILMPPQIFLGFFILMAVFTGIMLQFGKYYAEMFEAFLETF